MTARTFRKKSTNSKHHTKKNGVRRNLSKTTKTRIIKGAGLMDRLFGKKASKKLTQMSKEELIDEYHKLKKKMYKTKKADEKRELQQKLDQIQIRVEYLEEKKKINETLPIRPVSQKLSKEPPPYPHQLKPSRKAPAYNSINRRHYKKLISLNPLNTANQFEKREEKPITHYWYKSWKDRKIPVKTELKKFIDDTLMIDLESNAGTTLIHCSAGVGRTGTLYVIMALVVARQNKETIDKEKIVKTIREIRQRRPMMVQTAEQYKFICDYFDVQDEEYQNTFNSIGFYKIDKKTLIQSKCTTTKYNRYPDVLPYDNSRVVLDKYTDTTGNEVECSDYVNATILPDIVNQGITFRFIAAECPSNEKSINQFKRMLFEKDVRRIVMLTGLVESGRDKCMDYTGNVLTNVENDKTKDNIVINEMKLVKDYNKNLSDPTAIEFHLIETSA
jgi:protein tyrosine phosphatase